jgi:hypothetical protein
VNVTSGAIIRTITDRYGSLLGTIRRGTLTLPAIGVLGFPPEGEIEGCLVLVSPFPTGCFERGANGLLRSDGASAEICIRVYQFASDRLFIQALVQRIATLAPTRADIRYYPDSFAESQSVPYAEINLYGNWDIEALNQQEANCIDGI